MDTEGNEHRINPQTEREDPPPFMRSWNRIYITIALYTCALIVVLYIITVALNR